MALSFMTENKSSRLPGFYKLPTAERVDVIAEWAGLSQEDKTILMSQGLDAGQADKMIENALGTYGRRYRRRCDQGPPHGESSHMAGCQAQQGRQGL